VDGYATARPSAYYPFIMRTEGMGRLMGIKGLVDGPFPEHYEPKETPLTANPLSAGKVPSLIHVFMSIPAQCLPSRR